MIPQICSSRELMAIRGKVVSRSSWPIQRLQWHVLQVDLKAGANTIVLDQRNAIPNQQYELSQRQPERSAIAGDPVDFPSARGALKNSRLVASSTKRARSARSTWWNARSARVFACGFRTANPIKPIVARWRPRLNDRCLGDSSASETRP